MKKWELLGIIHGLIASVFTVMMLITWTRRDFAFWCFWVSVLLILANSFLTSVHIWKNRVHRGGLMYLPLAGTLAAVILIAWRVPEIVDYNCNNYLAVHIGVFTVSIIIQLAMFWKLDEGVAREGSSAVVWSWIKCMSAVLAGIVMLAEFMVVFVGWKPVSRFIWRTMADVMEIRGEAQKASSLRNMGVKAGDIIAADKALNTAIGNGDYGTAYSVMEKMKQSYGEREDVRRWVEKYTPKTPSCSAESGVYKGPLKVTFVKGSGDEMLYISDGDGNMLYDNQEFNLDKRGKYQYSVYATNRLGLESQRQYYNFYVDIPESYTAGGVIYDEILNGAENARGDWQGCYDKIIAGWQQMNRRFSSGYKYIYLNDDEIPELCLFCDDGTDKAMSMYTVVDGRVEYVSEYDMYGEPFLDSVFTSIDEGGRDFYIEKTGIFIHSGKKTGTGYYESYSLHHKLKLALEGDRSVINDCYEAYRLDGNRLEQIFCYIYLGSGSYEITYRKKNAAPDSAYNWQDKELSECDELPLIEAEYGFSYSDKKEIIPAAE